MANAPDFDDLDSILREREETRRETNAAGLRGTVLGMKGLAGLDLNSLPTGSSTTIPLPVGREEEEFNEDGFADFDFEAPIKPAPAPPVIISSVPAKFPTQEANLVHQNATLATVTETSKEVATVPSPDRKDSNTVPILQQVVTPPVTVAPSLPPVVTQQNKAGDVVVVDYQNYDPFDDFEYDANKPKKTVIMDPKQMKEFKSMDLGRKSEVSYSSGQEKSGNSDGQSNSRHQSGMAGTIPTLAQLAVESTSRVSAPHQKIDEETFMEEHEELIHHGRERSINTIAAGPSLSRPVLPTNFRLDPSLEDSSNLRIIDTLVSKTKTNKLQEEAIRLELESKDLKELIAQDLSDISLSDQEIEETCTQTSPTRESAKPKGVIDTTSGESGAVKNKEAKLRQKLEDLKKKASDKSKMHSIFLSKPQEEFERMAFTYQDEIHKIKESTGKLKIDLDSMNADMNKTNLAEISVENLRPNFFEFFSGKYGVAKCFIPDKSAANFIVGTDKGQLVVFDQKLIENYTSLQLSSVLEDYPVSMFPDWDNDLIWIGMNKGDIWVVKHTNTDNSLRKVVHSKDFSPSAEILDLVLSKNREHLVAVDGEYRVLYCKLDNSKPLDKIRIASMQIFFTKRDVLPHLEMKEVAPDTYLCVVSAGVQVTIFEFKPEVKNQKGPGWMKMLEMELDHAANLDSSILLPLYPVGHDPKKSESAGTTGDPNLITLADEKGDGETTRKGRRISETNESYPLLVRFTEDPNRSLVLAVAFKRTFYIFDLHPTLEKTFRAQTISEVRIRARAVSVSFFSTGKLILMDIFNDFYLIDVPLGVRYTEAQGLLGMQGLGSASDLGSISASLASSAVVQPKSIPTRTTSLRSTSLTNSINKTRDFLSSLNGHKTPSNVNGTLFVDSTQEFEQSCVFLIYPYGNIDQIVSTQTRTRSLTNYSNLISKSLAGEFFFVNQKGLIKLSVMNWKQYLDTCLAAGNYYKALKTINELLDGEFETLRRPPPKRQLPAELGPYIRRVVEEFVEELKMAPSEDIEIFMNYCMMTMIKNGMQDYIIDELETIMDKQELIGYFWRSLMLLFRSQLIPNLEFEKIMRIVAYLEQDPLEKQRFILYLFNKKLYREMLFNNLANRGNINLLFFLSSKVDEPHKSAFALEYVKNSIEIHGEDVEKRSKFYFQMFWYVSEFVEKRLQKKEIKYQDHSWYILNWFFNPNLISFLVQKDLKVFLEGWFLLFDNKFPQLMAFNNGLDLLQDYQIPINEIVNLKKTSLEMAALMSCIFSNVKHNPQDLNYFYFWIAIVKFHKVPYIELNDNALKELVLTLIRNINEIVSDPRLDITHEDLNILIFATFTEHKEIFVDNSELRDLIMKNEKSLRLLYHEMNRDISATFSLYRKLSRDNVQFKFRMFQWLKKGIEIKGEKEEIMNLIKNEFGFLVVF